MKKNQRTASVQERARGFTLIELMVTVAIIAILAAIAYPAYTNYIRRGQLSEASRLLADFRIRMEQYYQDQKNYGATACIDTNRPSWSTTAQPFAPGKYFTVACAFNGSNQSYTLTATGITGGLTANYVYTIDQDNNPNTTKFAGATTALPCWATRSASCDN